MLYFRPKIKYFTRIDLILILKLKVLNTQNCNTVLHMCDRKDSRTKDVSVWEKRSVIEMLPLIWQGFFRVSGSRLFVCDPGLWHSWGLCCHKMSYQPNSSGSSPTKPNRVTEGCSQRRDKYAAGHGHLASISACSWASANLRNHINFNLLFIEFVVLISLILKAFLEIWRKYSKYQESLSGLP